MQFVFITSMESMAIFLIHVWKSRCNEYEDLDDDGWAVPEKKRVQHFLKHPLGIMRFFTLPMEILDETKFHPS